MIRPEGGRIPQPYHHMMLANPARMAAFRHAISATVRPGDVVLEAGAGTGLLSALAARAGASRVDAVEWDPELAELARRVLAGAGAAEVVTVHEGSAEAFEPLTRPDVIICEMLHVGLLNERQVPVLRALLGRIPGPPPRVIPFAAVNAIQLLEVDYRYEGIEIPLVRACPHGLADPRIAAVSAAQTYWVCRMQAPEDAVEVTVTLLPERGARANAVALITKAVMTEAFDHPDNEWYLQQLLVPVPPRDVAEGEPVRLRVAYPAGAPLASLALDWEPG